MNFAAVNAVVRTPVSVGARNPVNRVDIEIVAGLKTNSGRESESRFRERHM